MLESQIGWEGVLQGRRRNLKSGTAIECYRRYSRVEGTSGEFSALV